MHLGNLLLDFQNRHWLLVTSTEINTLLAWSEHFSQRIRRKLLALARLPCQRLALHLTCAEREAGVRGGCVRCDAISEGATGSQISLRIGPGDWIRGFSHARQVCLILRSLDPF